MVLDINKAEYYNFITEGNAVEGFKLLSIFADAGVNLLAFKAVPIGSNQTKFSIFPDDILKMKAGAQNAGLDLDGPYTSIIVKGYGDVPGECANTHEKLAQAGIEVFESIGLANIKDSWGIVFCIKQKDCKKAMAILKD